MFNFRKNPYGMGYIKDKDDSRDYKIDNYTPLKEILENNSNDTSHIINENYFTPIKNQSSIGSCTAHAACALMEYYIKKRTGENYNLSEKFLYWTTRKLLGWENKDSGAYLRTTMQALTRFGVCEEKFARYNLKYLESPDWLQAALADDFKAETYIRIDVKGRSKQDIFEKIKTMINRDYPLQFGFRVFKNTIDNKTGNIAYPATSQKVTGGHAVVIVGYDDSYQITNKSNKKTTKGAFKIRNSWGTGWGDKGYGWLPYEYVLRGYASDFWVMFRADWIKLERFS
jgi:C1A family cysteine protease